MEPGAITKLLKEWKDGNEEAFQQVVELAYEDLRGLAHWELEREYRGSNLSTTELLNEVYESLHEKQAVDFENRKHFLHSAALAMRRLLIDLARERKALCKGGAFKQVTLPDHFELTQLTISPDQVLQIDNALNALEAQEEEGALLVKIVTLRFFAGYTIEETANLLDLTTITTNRKWKFAKAWLKAWLDQAE